MGAQLLLWFSVVASSKEPPDTIEWITAFCATALAMVALDRRHRAPLAALGVIVAVSVVGQILAPPDLLGLVPGLAVMVALAMPLGRRNPKTLARLLATFADGKPVDG